MRTRDNSKAIDYYVTPLIVEPAKMGPLLSVESEKKSTISARVKSSRVAVVFHEHEVAMVAPIRGGHIPIVKGRMMSREGRCETERSLCVVLGE